MSWEKGASSSEVSFNLDWIGSNSCLHDDYLSENNSPPYIPWSQQKFILFIKIFNIWIGEFEALGYPKTLAIYLSAEAGKVQGGRGGVFLQVNMIHKQYINRYFFYALFLISSQDVGKKEKECQQSTSYIFEKLLDQRINLESLEDEMCKPGKLWVE